MFADGIAPGEGSSSSDNTDNKIPSLLRERSKKLTKRKLDRERKRLKANKENIKMNKVN